MTRYKKITDIKAAPCYRHIPTRLFYLHLCMICHPVTGEFSCSLRDMAYICNVSLTSARTALKNLMRDGIVVDCTSSCYNGTTGKLSAYIRPQQPAEKTEKKGKETIDIDYVLANGWLKDMLPFITSTFPLTMHSARQAGKQFVQEMRSVGKTWISREDVRKHHLSWLQKDYLGIKTKKELQIRRKIFENEQSKK